MAALRIPPDFICPITHEIISDLTLWNDHATELQFILLLDFLAPSLFLYLFLQRMNKQLIY